MLAPSQGVKIYIATQPVDFRKGHDGLASIVMNQLRQSAFDGSIYVFRAKRADRLKLVFWDGSGLVMAYKRLEETRFVWPQIRDGIMRLNKVQFEALFTGLDWRKVRPLESKVPTAIE